MGEDSGGLFVQKGFANLEKRGYGIEESGIQKESLQRAGEKLVVSSACKEDLLSHLDIVDTPLCSPASASFDPALRMLWPREMKENSEGNGLPRIDLLYRCSLLYRWINGELIIDANLIFDPDNWERNERILGWKISSGNSREGGECGWLLEILESLKDLRCSNCFSVRRCSLNIYIKQ